MHLPIKREKKDATKCNNSSAAIIYFYQSVDYDKYLYHYIHDLALHFLLLQHNLLQHTQ